MIQTTRRHAKYPRQLSHYANAYGRSIETIAAWVRRGKVSGWLPPLDSPPAMRDWYARHIGAVPDDLSALCSGGRAAGAPAVAPPRSAGGNGQEDESGAPAGAAAAAAPLLDLEQAVIEIRAILAQDIAELKRAAGNGDDGRRGILLRHVRQTSDSLCKLENTLAGLRREKRDALPWGVFEEAVGKILTRLIDIRKGMPSRIMAEIETLYNHRVIRVVRLIKEPLLAAVEKVCEQDVQVLAQCPELRPVYEQMRQRARELEAADHAKP
jgi:hypothetical protein